MENKVVFRWKVCSPFFPKQRVETTFYSRCSTLYKWKLALQPTFQRINTWIFYLTITGIVLDEQDLIYARLVMVDILKDDRLVKSERQEFFAFGIENRHTFWVQAEVEIPPKQATQCLTIQVEIRLDERADPQVGGFTTESDQVQLSQDLRRILNDQRYSNMRLLPRGGLNPVHVHSYMIDARWNNFFGEHNLLEVDFPHIQPTVETDISEGLLSDLLVYLYSGVLPANWPDWKDVAYATELFQVIERYQLYHLYKVFVKSDSQQFHVTQKDVFVGCRSFRLDDDNGQLLEGHSETWRQNDSSYMFDFRIEISRSNDGPCVSYSLQSRSPNPTQARVNLVFARYVVDQPTRLVLRRAGVSVHVIDYDLDPSRFVSSEPIPFVGDTPIFNDFDIEERSIRRGLEIQHFMRCYVNMSDGSAVVQVRNAEGESLQTDREKFSTLQDHLQALNYAPLDADFIIYCREENPGHPDGPPGVSFQARDRSLHKAIFATRVPAYWGVLRNVALEGDIPDSVNCDLRIDSMEAVLLYIYAGRISAFPIPFAREMYEFAQRSDFIALMDMIARMGFQGNQ